MEKLQGPGSAGGKRTADKFLEACLLQLLSEGTGHGYVLMEQLEQFGFSPEAVNLSTLYRTLRHMEKDGCLKSVWQEGGPGPKRRIYLILEKGRRELDLRIRMMKTRKSHIERLIGEYDRASEQAVQPRSETPGDGKTRKRGAGNEHI